MKVLRNITRSLAFRIIMPVIALVILAGIGLYIFVLSSVSDFTDRHIKDALMGMSREIYNICARNLNELLKTGAASDEKAARIKRGLTIGMIEDFMQQNNLKGIIAEKDNEVLLAYGLSPGLLKIVGKNAEHNTVSSLEYDDKKHYAYRMQFEPWDWQIVFIKDAAEYSSLINNVRLAYMATGAILSITALLILFYLNRSIKYPINKIIASLKAGEQPEYEGIYEFEFLSKSISEMTAERQRLMKQIIEEQKLKGIRVLATGVAHNFNNMLVGVLGYASLISMKLEDAKRGKQTLQGEDIDELLKYTETIESSAQKASGLARDLAGLSRKRMLEKESVMPIDINKLITELQRLLSGTFPKNIEITAKMNDGLPAIKGDIMQLEQALLNIAINSKDAMPDGGKLTMKTFVTDIVNGNSKYHYLKAGKYVAIQISDTGTGMDEATLSHIFEPFFTTKPVDKGTGLGLATVYSIIKAHHGYVIAESIPDKGSTFTIYLPIEEKNPKL
ncbi:two-component system sensor histidine kinase NtrB [Dissulfurispira sp.]|uniref:two-component system sensor histidine kinase NtrB n=1 Tax=Dissulfurispira sp. TaxID=2817609 RepID=UPI002FDAA93A